MGVLDELAIEGGKRLERRLGKRAALRTLAPVLDSMGEGAGRARLHLRVMVLAAEVDRPRFEALAAAWPAERGAKHRDVKRAIRDLLVRGAAAVAVDVAEVEVARTGGAYDEASARFALGRAREAAGDRGGARREYERARLAADEQPSLRRRVEVRAVRVDDDPDRAAALAGPLLPLADAPRADRLAVAVAALASPGRYRRAAAIDVLDELSRGGDEVARHALARAARHAETTPLSPIESDRLRALFEHRGHPEAIARIDALGRFGDGEASRIPDADRAALRARAVLDGMSPGPRPEADGRGRVGWVALAIVHACRERRVAEARARLREATDLVDGGARVEAALWTAAHVAIAASPSAARALTTALLDRGIGEPPPRGFGALADAWLAAGAHDEGVRLLRRAARLREPGSRRRLASHLRTEGWRAAAEGRRDDAIALLREAKALAR